jgi:hypothetical protein
MQRKQGELGLLISITMVLLRLDGFLHAFFSFSCFSRSKKFVPKFFFTTVLEIKEFFA